MLNLNASQLFIDDRGCSLYNVYMHLGLPILYKVFIDSIIFYIKFLVAIVCEIIFCFFKNLKKYFFSRDKLGQNMI